MLKKFTLTFIFMVITFQTYSMYLEQFEIEERRPLFFCEICLRHIECLEEVDLKFHLENTHFTCSKCYQTFESRYAMRMHFTNTHDNK